MRKGVFFAVSFISAASIMTELALTKIFSVLFFHHFAFLIISIALLGYAAAGVYLSIKEDYSRYYKRLSFYALSMGIMLLLVFKTILQVPLDFTALPQTKQIVYLIIYFLILLIPFFIAGIILSLIFSMLTEKANKLYLFDLVGAAVGGAIFGFGISLVGGQGIIVMAASFAIIGSILIEGKFRTTLLASLLIVLALIPFSEKAFKFHYNMAKRNFIATLDRIEYSKWSPIFKIDVATYTKTSKIIWIDAGTNQSFMHRIEEDLRYDENIPRGARIRDISIPYIINPKGTYLIIGPAGGLEVFVALTYLPKMIYAVELDPVIVDVVKNRYSSFIGNLYRSRRVLLINDEGRSYIKRSKEKFDVIQEVNNCTPAAIASGVLNFSESYILTVEAFQDYWNHLNPGGIIAIHTWGSAKLLAMAKELLKRNGIKNPQDYIAIVGGGGLRNLFMLRKGKFTEEDIKKIEEEIEWVNAHSTSPRKMYPIYLPHRPLINNIETAVLTGSIADLEKQTNLVLTPPTDDRPFFYRFLSPFNFKIKGNLVSPDFKATVEKYHFQASISLLAIIVILLILSFVLIPYPLFIFHRKGIKESKSLRFMLFFAFIGLAFIFVEIVFIKKFILFLGNPVYSITIVIVSLLLSAGIGSGISSKLKPSKIKLISLILFIISVDYIFLLSPIFNATLQLNFLIRLLISFVLISIIGVFMGMMFPTGLKLARKTSVNLIPWAWGVNGFFTVMGSALTVLLAVLFGFNFVLFLAALIYLLAGISIPTK